MCSPKRWKLFVFYLTFNVWIDSQFSTLTALEIVGAGASFPRDVYRVWMSTYAEIRRQHKDVSIIYDAKGSGVGLSRIKGETQIPVDFAGSDSVLTEDEYSSNPDLQMFPTMAGAVALVYNLLGIDHLVLNQEQIVGIYNGTFTHWNDTTFKDTNPTAIFPNEKILVIARKDKSGTTEMFTRALSAFSPEWKTTYGVFSKGLREDDQPWFWNSSVITYYGRGAYDVLFLLSITPFSIGYVSLAAAKYDGAKFAKIVNRFGDTVTPQVDSVTKAIESFSSTLSHRLTGSLVDSAAEGAYPIVGYTYFVIRLKNNTDCEVAKEFLRFVMWFLSVPSAARTCAQLGFSIVSPSVKKKIQSEVVTKMMCQGNIVVNLVRADIEREDALQRQQLADLPLKIAVPIVVIVIVISSGISFYLRIKTKRALDRNDWNIAIEDIVFVEPSSLSSTRSTNKFQTSFLSLTPVSGRFSPEGASLNDIIHWPARWNNHSVSVKIQNPIPLQPIESIHKRALSSYISRFVQENIVRVFGLTTVGADRYVVTEYCSRGVLQDILHDDKLNLNLSLKFSISADILSGLHFLHANDLIHGNLSTACCLLDSRWTVKIADWENRWIKRCVLGTVETNGKNSTFSNTTNEDSDSEAVENFWTAPEIIQSPVKVPVTKSGDVYSFAICLHEIFTRETPFSNHANISPKEVLVLILTNNLRPLPTEDVPISVRQIMEKAWADDPEGRPSVSEVAKLLDKANPGKRSVMDSMMETMEEYACKLEKTIEEKAEELAWVTKRSTQISSCAVPQWLLANISTQGTSWAKNLYKSCIACILFSGVSRSAETSGAETALDVINEIYNILLQTVHEEGFILVPHTKSPILIAPYNDHMTTLAWVTNIVEILLTIMSKTADINIKDHQNNGSQIKLKISLHLGSATIGYVYSLSQIMAFGNGIDTAKSLADHSREGTLLVSEDVHEVMRFSEVYCLEQKTKIKLKDRSSLMTYTLSEYPVSLDLENNKNEECINMTSVDC